MLVSEQAVDAMQAYLRSKRYILPSGIARAALTAAAPFLQGVKVDSMDTAPKNGDEFLARCGKEWPWFSCFWDGSAFVHYDYTDGIVHYPATEWIPIPKRMLALAPSPRAQALEPDFWAVHSKSGVHIGLWPTKAHADEALREYEGGTITPLYRATHDHEDGFRSGIEAAAKLAEYFEETIYSEGMTEDVYYGISCTVSQVIREIRALSSQPVSDGWMPIETAPKDGTVIQVWHQVHKCPISVLWKDDGFPYRGERLNWYERSYTTAWPERAFTHWRPLPASPGASE